MPENHDQPDIEIYVRDASLQNILDWLRLEFDQVSISDPGQNAFSKGKPAAGKLSLEGQSIPVFIMPNAAGKAFTSIWFKSNKTNWINDEACALSFLSFLDTEVRCSATSWHEQEEEGSDQWWLIKRNEKRLIRWG